MSGRIEMRLGVTADHPSLPGHFPGQPVVPGVLLLERLIEAAQESLGTHLRVTGLPQVKFLAPLLPGEEAMAVMEWQMSPSAAGVSQPTGGNTTHEPHASAPHTHTLRIRVERARQTIAQGVLQVVISRE